MCFKHTIFCASSTRKKRKEKEKEVADRNLNLAFGSSASALASVPGVANAGHVPGSGIAGFFA